jgi:tRNA-specific 2-thiouridylase
MMTKKPKKLRVLVAMSGGVDSSVAAALLVKSRKYEVAGAYMKNWSDEEFLDFCTSEKDQFDARRVAAKLGIPFYTFNFEKEYYEAVVKYMIEEYRSGRTPNPDMLCNREIKFGIFLKKALALGFDYVATGHYVKVKSEKLKVKNRNKKKENIYKLFQAKDKNKDQSYFLSQLTQDQLRRAIFPIGDFIKPEVRKLAKEFSLPTADKKDSQGICFIGPMRLLEFLKTKIKSRQGLVKTLSGKIVGHHEGAEFFTIGQRKGIGSLGGGVPYFVVAKDTQKNILYVSEGDQEDLYKKELTAQNINWISGSAPKKSFQALARIRYRQPLQKCEVVLIKKNYCHVIFNELQRAVTPGQFIVFYLKSGEMLGGGVIK